MPRLFSVALCLLICAAATATNVFAQAGDAGAVNRDPDKARFVTSDIDNFWRAFELAGREPDREKRIAIFQTEYFDRGSIGLQDFLRLRIKSAKDLALTVEKLPRFYASVRPSTLRIKRLEREMRASFRRFKRLYPDAVFPDVYFVVGVASTGGTVSKNGLLIGAELHGLTGATPRDELFAWIESNIPSQNTPAPKLQAMINRLLDALLHPLERIVPIVAHEAVHFNQKYPASKTLLAKSIEEGAADFIAEKIAGQTISPRRQTYGDRHEAELWRDFQTEMTSAELKNWLYNGLTTQTRPPDLGYYMGYKICQSYYKHAPDKRQAVRALLEIKDFPSFFQQSGYREKFAP